MMPVGIVHHALEAAAVADVLGSEGDQLGKLSLIEMAATLPFESFDASFRWCKPACCCLPFSSS
jgi:hypothetical protein